LQGLTLFGIMRVMPSKNTNKIYVKDGYYHIYNRGVEKRDIFLDTRDYAVFIGYLKEYLSPKDENTLIKQATDPEKSSTEKLRITRKILLKNYSAEITLLAYSLMPNHFHLFLKQHTADAIDRLMSSLGSRYTIYFNRSHNRIGALYQGVYKAVLMTSEAQYLHITRYVHKQALAGGTESNQDFPSSYPEYLGLRKTDWVHPEEILSFFSNTNPTLSYKNFVSEYNPIFEVFEPECEV
jgi:putative transposase